MGKGKEKSRNEEGKLEKVRKTRTKKGAGQLRKKLRKK
jgi:hypothetical protein